MKFFRSPLFWVLIAFPAAVILGGFVLWKLAANPLWKLATKKEESSEWQKVVAREKAIEQKKQAAKSWPDERIAQAVREYVLDAQPASDNHPQKRVLTSLQRRVDPAVLSVLRDASLQEKLTVPTRSTLGPEAPVERLCDLIDENPPDGAVELLAPFLENPTPNIRKSAALVIGSAGVAVGVAPLRKAFADADERVRSAALIGLQRAVDGNRLEEQCRRELFDDLQRLVGTTETADYAAPLLLDFDQERAVAFLLSPAVFTPSSKALSPGLEALANKKIAIPRDRLLALVPELEKSASDESKFPALGSALRLLGQHKKDEDRALLEARTSHEDEQVAEGAAAGLLALDGLDGYQERLWKKEEDEGFDKLSAPQKHIAAVDTLDGEVNNGGFSQYFSNSSGDQWGEALAGLETMGFKERTAMLREAVAKFGKKPPSANRQTRQGELERLEQKNDTLFEALDQRYYDSKEPVQVYMHRYARKHPDEFR